MSLRRAASLVLSVFALSCLAGLIVLSSPAPPREGEWDTRIAVCAAYAPADMLTFEKCPQGVWQSAFDAGMLKALNTALTEAQGRDAAFGGRCHLPGHKAGRYAFAQTGDIGALVRLAAADRFACDNGFLHGALDGFAKSGVGPDRLVDAYAACGLLRDVARDNCVDGSGHATWQVTHDWGAAFDECMRYATKLDRSNCFGGVIMQMFLAETDGSRPADYGVAQAPQTIPRLCAFVDERAVSYMSDVCYEIGGRYLYHDAVDRTVRYVDQVLDRPGASSAAVTEDQVLAAWQDGVARCDQLANASGAHSCKVGLAQAVIWVARVPELVEAVCGSLPGDYARMCRDSKAR